MHYSVYSRQGTVRQVLVTQGWPTCTERSVGRSGCSKPAPGSRTIPSALTNPAWVLCEICVSSGYPGFISPTPASLFCRGRSWRGEARRASLLCRPAAQPSWQSAMRPASPALDPARLSLPRWRPTPPARPQAAVGHSDHAAVLGPRRRHHPRSPPRPTPASTKAASSWSTLPWRHTDASKMHT